MGQQEASGKTEEAKTATGAVDSPWPGRRSLGPPHLHLRRHHGWTIESVFSRHKRLLGSALRGKSDSSRERECYLRVLTHDLMLLAAAG